MKLTNRQVKALKILVMRVEGNRDWAFGVVDKMLGIEHKKSDVNVVRNRYWQGYFGEQMWKRLILEMHKEK